MKRIAIGLVGCGGMGRRHLRAYTALRAAGADLFSVAAVCDPRPDAAEAAAAYAAEALGERPKVFASHKDLLASGVVQAIDVVTDPSAHHGIVVEALEQGVHVTCEKPLGLTVRACQRIVEAAERSNAVLSTAENYRRDSPNRLARAVLDAGLLGRIHLMVQQSLGGSDQIMISPWRHLATSGPMALDMGVHYSDIIQYYFGEYESAFGQSFIAEPIRRYPPDMPRALDIPEIEPGAIQATGDDSLLGLFEMRSGVWIQLAYIPSGPGERYFQRTIHGSLGSMTIPRDRSGGAVVVRLGDEVLSGADLRAALGGFRLDPYAARFFGEEGTEYDLSFAEVDAATLGIELEEFASAVVENRRPEVDGRAGLVAVAAIWALAESKLAGARVRVDDVASGAISAAQRGVDQALGLL
ncbi:MAG: Gfo/Idh/MocA family oxidoreductase [Actinomycetota bacterium]|nr:Gfo/Idh/MocA family oxidoreductase [Actinomycetota bacterium]